MTGNDTLEKSVRDLVRSIPGRRLPPERDLAARFGTSRPRLRVVLAQLGREGLIEARQGSGTYASASIGETPEAIRRVSLVIDSSLKLGDDPFFSLLLEKLLGACQAAGAGCTLSRFRPGESLPSPEDGRLTLGLDSGAEALSATDGLTALVALLAPPDARPSRRASIFQLDDASAGADAARRLIARGCRRLVFFGHDFVPAARERLRGAAEVCAAEPGISLEQVPCGLNYAAGMTAGWEMSVDDSGTRGIIAANDWLALGLRAGLGPAGRDIPVVSFDGLPLAADPALGIESLAIPVDDIARDALLELARLRRSPGGVGRTLRYGLEG